LKRPALLNLFWPQPLHINARERIRASAGVALGVAITALLSLYFANGDVSHPWLVAPIGASAVLIFAVPSSPLAQPWGVLGGNTLSVLIGALCAAWISHPILACTVAVTMAVVVMLTLRCLHPPGGAAALLAALSGVDYHFALFPVLTNCAILVVIGIAYNSLTGRRYPHRPATPQPAADAHRRLTRADLDAALDHYNQVVDVNRDELDVLLQHAQAASYQRRFGDLRCADIMTRDVVTAEFGTLLEHAWKTMLSRRIKALPVIDRGRHVVGIVTSTDFMRLAGLDTPRGIRHRVTRIIKPSGRVHSDQPEVVGQIMTRPVNTLHTDRPLSELVPLFSQGGHHHIPIVDDTGKLAGIITQTDLVKALYGATTGHD